MKLEKKYWARSPVLNINVAHSFSLEGSSSNSIICIYYWIHVEARKPESTITVVFTPGNDIVW